MEDGYPLDEENQIISKSTFFDELTIVNVDSFCQNFNSNEEIFISIVSESDLQTDCDGCPLDEKEQITCLSTFVGGQVLLEDPVSDDSSSKDIEAAIESNEVVSISGILSECDNSQGDFSICLADSVTKLVTVATEPFSNFAFQPEFYCDICLENCSTSLIFQMSSCCKNHTFCKPCLSGYFTSMVKDGSIQHFCPGVSCQAAVSSAELKILLDEESFARYERLSQVKQNPMYRECPKCGMGATAPPSAGILPELSCVQCGTKYCFFHADAHIGLSCRQYARNQSSQTRRELAASHSLVGKTTKKCPHCKSPTEKNGGCNHMTCQSCAKDWCWLCVGKINGSIKDHYNPANFLFGCPGGQYQPDHNTSQRIANLFFDCSPTFSEGLGWVLRAIGSLFFMIRNILLFLLGLVSMISLAIPVMILIGFLYSLYKRKFNSELIFKIIPIVCAFVLPSLFAIAIDIPCIIATLPLATIGACMEGDTRKDKLIVFAKCLESVSSIMFLIHLCH